MPQPRRRNRVIIGVLALGLLAGGALTAHPAQAVDAVGPYYADPAWDQQLVPATRFGVLTNWASQAVLDKETGLVWEKTPSGNFFFWIDARHHCTHETTTGARKGWRLPAVHELASLIDTTVATPGLTLPPGHPFVNVLHGTADDYWSATSLASPIFPTLAWVVTFRNGVVVSNYKDNSGGPSHVWCVRGGMNADAY